MYSTPLFLQSVRLDSPEKAGATLVIPSVAFTISSALSAFITARIGSPQPLLVASQILLLLGVIGLVLMSTISPDIGAPDALYSAMLVLPAVGVGTMAPGTILALLNFTRPEDHAAANGGFAMTRSLGVFIAT